MPRHKMKNRRAGRMTVSGSENDFCDEGTVEGLVLVEIPGMEPESRRYGLEIFTVEEQNPFPLPQCGH